MPKLSARDYFKANRIGKPEVWMFTLWELEQGTEYLRGSARADDPFVATIDEGSVVVQRNMKATDLDDEGRPTVPPEIQMRAEEVVKNYLGLLGGDYPAGLAGVVIEKPTAINRNLPQADTDEMVWSTRSVHVGRDGQFLTFAGKVTENQPEKSARDTINKLAKGQFILRNELSQMGWEFMRIGRGYASYLLRGVPDFGVELAIGYRESSRELVDFTIEDLRFHNPTLGVYTSYVSQLMPVLKNFSEWMQTEPKWTNARTLYPALEFGRKWRLLNARLAEIAIQTESVRDTVKRLGKSNIPLYRELTYMGWRYAKINPAFVTYVLPVGQGEIQLLVGLPVSEVVSFALHDHAFWNDPLGVCKVEALRFLDRLRVFTEEVKADAASALSVRAWAQLNRDFRRKDVRRAP